METCQETRKCRFAFLPSPSSSRTKVHPNATNKKPNVSNVFNSNFALSPSLSYFVLKRVSPRFWKLRRLRGKHTPGSKRREPTESESKRTKINGRIFWKRTDNLERRARILEIYRFPTGKGLANVCMTGEKKRMVEKFISISETK